jgi:DNA-binding response OmpR family regulator
MATVLLVEDEPRPTDLVRRYLEHGGIAVLSTGSGAEAISLSSSARPDLMILDLGLPDVPGETVAREVRSAGSTPIVMLTARGSEADRIAAWSSVPMTT